MKHLMIALAMIAATASLVACGDGGDATPASPAVEAAGPGDVVEEVAAAPAEPEEEITEASPIWFEPEAMSTCPDAEPVAGVVHWNASSFEGVTTVQVTLPAEGQPDGMFAVSATIGEKETGPWLAAGTEFVLRDNATGEELARARMPGKPCET